MSTWSKLGNIWKNVQEVDLRPIRKAAEQDVRLAIVGRDADARRALAALLGVDPWHPGSQVPVQALLLDLTDAGAAVRADVVILLSTLSQDDLSAERELAAGLSLKGVPVIAVLKAGETQGAMIQPQQWDDWGTARLLNGDWEDRAFLLDVLTHALLEVLPDRQLALGRRFPMLRQPIARQLINDTAFSNAAYALSTGLAEIVPVLDLPLNIADMLVLTKAQALLVYRLGLLLGMSTDWKFYLGEFGSVVGGGFLWRQVARQLVGLIPVIGILPKVAVAYAGTYTVGQVVLRWYQTGRHLTREEMRALSRQSFALGRQIAGELASRLPRRRRKRKPERLPASQHPRACPKCSTANEIDAKFCKNCGQGLGTDLESA